MHTESHHNHSERHIKLIVVAVIKESLVLTSFAEKFDDTNHSERLKLECLYLEDKG